MALDFPSSPSLNQVYRSPTGESWRWNGFAWNSLGTGAGGPQGPNGTNGTIGVNGATGSQGPIGATGPNNPATNLFLFYNY
jgi:hypothetical protein